MPTCRMKSWPNTFLKENAGAAEGRVLLADTTDAATTTAAARIGSRNMKEERREIRRDQHRIDVRHARLGVGEGLEGSGMMTRTEQAYVKRLKKRICDLYMGYCVIKTWISMPKDEEDTIYHIASLCTEKILNEKAAMKKEGESLYE